MGAAAFHDHRRSSRRLDLRGPRDEFRAALERGGFNPTHIAVADGNRAVYSDVLQAWQVPDYAKERVPAYV